MEPLCKGLDEGLVCQLFECFGVSPLRVEKRALQIKSKQLWTLLELMASKANWQLWDRVVKKTMAKASHYLTVTEVAGYKMVQDTTILQTLSLSLSLDA